MKLWLSLKHNYIYEKNCLKTKPGSASWVMEKTFLPRPEFGAIELPPGTYIFGFATVPN